MVRRIIIDTDIGDDIDDALAIALALRSPELDLLGVTTVFGDTIARARIARALLDAAGRADIPVYAGCGQPLCNSEYPKDLPNQYDPSMDALRYERVHAVEYLIDMAQKYAEDLTILPIGALTNLALAIRLAPGIMRSVGGLVLMGGAFDTQMAEWNIRCDPEAAAIVFDSGIPIRAVGLDVTMRCRTDRGHWERMMADNPDAVANILQQLLRRWHAHTGHYPTLHDPLTIAATFDESLLDFRPARVVVDHTRGPARAMTLDIGRHGWEDGHVVEQPNTQVAQKVKAERFLELFMERVFGQK